jgi:hypothetical protein
LVACGTNDDDEGSGKCLRDGHVGDVNV